MEWGDRGFRNLKLLTVIETLDEEARMNIASLIGSFRVESALPSVDNITLVEMSIQTGKDLEKALFGKILERTKLAHNWE